MFTPAQLLEAIRKEALPAVWSRGVNLTRASAVALESQTPSEVVLRVKAAGRPVPFSAILYPGDEVWECNCPGHFDPCDHVVAVATITFRTERYLVPDLECHETNKIDRILPDGTIPTARAARRSAST